MNHYIFDLDDTLLVHRNDINYTLIRENTELSHYLNQCRGRRYIYTNGNFSHANEVLERMNLTEKFEKVYSRDTLPEMKPSFNAGFMVQQDILKDRFESGANVYEVQKDKFVFFDDIPHNLRPAKNLGWKTVWIHPKHEESRKYRYIDHAYPNLVEALKDLTTII